MCTTLLLLVEVDFINTFVLECDASGRNLKVVLMQNDHLLAFTSKQLCGINLVKSTYDEEIMSIFHAL